MSRLFDDASSEYLSVNQAVLSGVPLALACWFNSNSLTINQTLISITDDASAHDVFKLSARGDQAGDYIRAETGDSVLFKLAASSIAYSANVWQHGCAIFASSTDRRVLLNGGNKGTDSDDVTPADLDSTNIGFSKYGTPSGYMSGYIAEAAIWDLSVWPGATDSDKADNFEKILPSLAKGFTPDNFPLGLKAYWPLVRGLTDKVGGFNLTADGTVVTPHCNVIRPHGVG